MTRSAVSSRPLVTGRSPMSHRWTTVPSSPSKHKVAILVSARPVVSRLRAEAVPQIDAIGGSMVTVAEAKPQIDSDGHRCHGLGFCVGPRHAPGHCPLNGFPHIGRAAC